MWKHKLIFTIIPLTLLWFAPLDQILFRLLNYNCDAKAVPSYIDYTTHYVYASKVVVEPWSGRHHVYGLFMLLDKYKLGQPAVLTVKGAGRYCQTAVLTGNNIDGIYAPPGYYLIKGNIRTRTTLWLMTQGLSGQLTQARNWKLTYKLPIENLEILIHQQHRFVIAFAHAARLFLNELGAGEIQPNGSRLYSTNYYVLTLQGNNITVKAKDGRGEILRVSGDNVVSINLSYKELKSFPLFVEQVNQILLAQHRIKIRNTLQVLIFSVSVILVGSIWIPAINQFFITRFLRNKRLS